MAGVHSLIHSILVILFQLVQFAHGCGACRIPGAAVLPYDYSASVECLEVPARAQYGGGLILNPEFDDGLKGWTTFGRGEIEERTFVNGGNKYAATVRRSHAYQSISHELYLEKGKLYTLSAWLQVNEGNASITAAFKTASNYTTHAGTVLAKSGCWSMLKGGITVDTSGPAKLYFEAKNTTSEIWVDSVSVQPFTEEEWRAHREESIEKVRKRRVAFTVRDAAEGNPRPGAIVTIKQALSGFPFGCAISGDILTNGAYQGWFASKGFTVTTFENEMKWYSTERSQGQEDYSTPDAMLAFARQHGIAVRGHNVLWDDPKFQPQWLTSLSLPQLQAAVSRRINSIMSRYRGQLIAWDVVNENMHNGFFESKLGSGASAEFYQMAQQLDPATALFLNEYNTIEEPSDQAATPNKYLQKVREMGNVRNLAIGVQGHFNTPNIPYMRASLDTLAGASLPIWLTEVDVGAGPNQAGVLEQVLREAHAHPAVRGIVMWAAWHPQGCYRMCLTDGSFKNLATGDAVDRLMAEWRTHPVEGTTDGRGVFETRLFHGDYEVTVSHPAMNASSTKSLLVAPGSSPEEPLQIELIA